MMLLRLSAAVPVLLRVTTWAALVDPTNWPAKVRLPGATPAIGATAVPVKLTDCVLAAAPVAFSVTERVPVRVPVAVGLKLTVMVQLAPAAKEVPHILLSAKSPPLVPAIVTLVMESATELVLERVRVCVALGLPTN
jgi:hypothetical protein